MGNGFRLSLSSEICPEIREYPRVSTTVINAYIRPQIISYLDRLESGLARNGFKGNLFIMSSAGGVLHPQTAKDMPSALVESGPAAGALAAAYFARLTKRKQVLAFDMGGTTAKACLIENAQPVLGQDPHPLGRVLLVGRMGGVGVALVVEVVQQADQPPGFRVLALALGHRPHRDLDRVHVLSQRVRGGVLQHQREGLGSGEGHVR